MMVSLFPFPWCKGHFTNCPQDYSFENRELDEQDKASHAALWRYVEGFNTAQWVTREGVPVVDENGEFVWEAHAINTKALLACKTYGEDEALLGLFKCMLFAPYS